ncbi:MAG: antibiotic biosynthesis monooxygenase [Pseudomonadota bacterium]
MIMAIDLIQAEDVKRAKNAWDFVSGYLSECNGFERCQLLSTFKEVKTRANYPLASVCRWDSAEDWDNARAAARKDWEVIRVLRGSNTKFTGFTMDLVDGQEYNFSRNRNACVLLDVIYLDKSRMSGYAEMWNRCAAFMSSQPGYVNASLYQNQSLNDEIKFINIAEWDDAESLFHAAHTDEFNEIVEPFMEDFALYLTNRAGISSVPMPQGAVA